MSYNEFDINSAINPVKSRESVKLVGVNEVAKIYNSNSASTEEFISGAIHNLGVVNRNVMFVNSSLSGLRDRLSIAAHVAKNVNMAKDRGIEGFGSVNKMDPWEYALESGIGDFFDKIWKAIYSACCRLIQAIANIIKHIQVFITKADTRKQSKDYKYYMTNKAILEANAKKSGVLKTKFNAMNWKGGANDIADTVGKVASLYTTAFNGIFGAAGDGKILANLGQVDISQAKDLAGFKLVSKKIFGGAFTFNEEASGSKLTNYINDHVVSKIEEPRLAVVKMAKVTGEDSATTAAHKLLLKNDKDEKVVQVTVDQMKKASNDFEVLSDAWLAKNVTKHVTALNAAVKTFTQYTKNIEKAAAQFKKVAVDNTKAATIKALSSALSDMSDARIRNNSYFTTLMLEMELCALRFRKNAHTALTLYIRGKVAAPAAEKKSKESLDTNMLFAI